MNLPSCHPEQRKGSDELLSETKNASTNAFQILHFVQNDTEGGIKIIEL